VERQVYDYMKNQLKGEDKSVYNLRLQRKGLLDDIKDNKKREKYYNREGLPYAAADIRQRILKLVQRLVQVDDMLLERKDKHDKRRKDSGVEGPGTS